MSNHPLRTALIGFGNVAAGYADDELMKQYYPYASHAQVLSAHPDYEWVAVVDPCPIARRKASDQWKVPFVCSSVDELANCSDVDVVVIATPPSERLDIIQKMPSVKGVLLEKPPTLNYSSALKLMEFCEKHHVVAQVNYWRRGDECFRHLAKSMSDYVGEIQTVFGLYGRGLINNGSHIIDFTRMLCGEMDEVQAISKTYAHSGSSINEDINLAFSFISEKKVINVQPINFDYYRECSLDIWGEKGRLAIMQEGLTIHHYRQSSNRTTRGAFEIPSDSPQVIESTVGNAFYHMYTNLSEAIRGRAMLWSPLKSALLNMKIINAIHLSSQKRGEVMNLQQEVYEL